jgi:hypothetical protein
MNYTNIKIAAFLASLMSRPPWTVGVFVTDDLPQDTTAVQLPIIVFS